MPLNENQARAITTSLRHCEQTLQQMERLLAGDGAEAGRLVRWRWDLAPAQRAALAAQLQALRQEVERLADDLGLEAEERNGVQWVRGQLALNWVTLEEVGGRKLAVYGPLEPDVIQTLLPRLGQLAASVQRALSTLDAPSTAKLADDGDGPA